MYEPLPSLRYTAHGRHSTKDRSRLCGHHDILTSGKAPIAAAVYLSLRQRLLLQPDENIRPPLRYASRQLDDLGPP